MVKKRSSSSFLDPSSVLHCFFVNFRKQNACEKIAKIGDWHDAYLRKRKIKDWWSHHQAFSDAIYCPASMKRRPWTVIHKTHWGPQQVGCHRGNNELLKTGPQFQVLDTACLPLFSIFGQEVWMNEKKQQQQTVFFPLIPVCQNEGQSESLSQPQSEFAILPLCQLMARLFWRDRWKRSPLYGKKGKYIKHSASTSSCSGEWEQSSDIPASCKSLADLANKIASNVWKDDGAPLLFPPKHVRQWLWCWTNLTQGASSGVGGILEQTFRVHLWVMSITVIVCILLWEVLIHIQEMLRYLHDGFSRQPYKGFITLLLVCWESAPHGPGPSQPVTPAWSERMPFLNCQRWTGGLKRIAADDINRNSWPNKEKPHQLSPQRWSFGIVWITLK